MRSFLGITLLAALLAAPAAADSVALRGQIVCAGCWDEADRSKVPYGNAADLQCAARCEKQGIAAALMVKEGSSWKMLKLEDGAFKREGKGWLKYMGKRAEVTGTVREAGKERYLKVDALTILPDEPEKKS